MAENKENVATSPERAQLKAHRKESDLNLNPQQLLQTGWLTTRK